MPLRCLIVDDNPHFLEAARGLLQQAGIVVGVASSSADALAKVEHFHPDVTLVDIQLGEESGLDLARKLAEAPNGQRSNVILCSAHSAQDLACLTDDSPALAFLPKSDLSATAIHEILERADGLASLGTRPPPAAVDGRIQTAAAPATSVATSVTAPGANH